MVSASVTVKLDEKSLDVENSILDGDSLNLEDSTADDDLTNVKDSTEVEHGTTTVSVVSELTVIVYCSELEDDWTIVVL